MNKREIEEHHSRNFWDSCHADGLMSVLRCCELGQWRDEVMEAHLNLVWHYAHDENARHDFCVRHKIKSVLHLQNLVTGVSCHA